MKITKATVAVRRSFTGPMLFEIRIGNDEKTLSLSRVLPDDDRDSDHLVAALVLIEMARALEG